VEGLIALVSRALQEDIGPGDITTESTVEEDADARALITQKAPGAIYGLDAAATAFALLDPDARTERLVQEGVWREQGGPVMSVEGRARALLSAERTALNFLAHLSGVATMAARAARAVEGTGAKVLDTRKTTPGLRALEKAAAALACHSAVRFGDVLEPSEQRRLLADLESTEESVTCPHGRPTRLLIEWQELTRHFRRNY